MKGAIRGDVGKAAAAEEGPPGRGEKAGSMPSALIVGEAQGKPGEWSGSVGGVGKPPEWLPPPPPPGKNGDLG